MSHVIFRILPLLGLLLWPFAVTAQTADYPSRSIRFVVPYAAGGIADLLARTVAQHLGPELGQTIVIENQTGAGGHLGGSAVAKAAPDGYTLVLATIAHNAAASMYGNLNYNPETDLKPVVLIAESAGVLVVNPSVPAKTVTEFIAYAKANRLSYASAGHGSAIHLAAELFKSMAGVDLVHVPYRGSAPAMTDLLGGSVQVMFENIPSALQHVRAGSIRPLGVTSPKRSPLMPETPTIAEAGVPGYAAVPWYTISVASGVPADVVAKLNKAINTVLVRPDLAQRWSELGVTPLGGSPQDAEKRNADETRRWSEVIKSAGIKAQ
ncbi:MAG: tripartite tricarboxylate transporter substrate binding protein [Pseudolabrys sp.]|nr:tripartite tricarboxylate transporter substrate binding protein [Pseudolabrys sp.]